MADPRRLIRRAATSLAGVVALGAAVVATGGVAQAQAVDPAEAVGFHATTPHRLLDTRATTTLRAGATLPVPAADTAHVPSTANAVVLNVTAVNAAGAGYLTVFPCDAPRPLASHVNDVAGSASPNQVVATVDANGYLCVYTTTSTDVVVDVNGYFDEGAGAGYAPVAPVRAFDSRLTAPLQARTPVEVAIAGRFGVPADATAVGLNVTATNPADGGYVSVYPCASGSPATSSVNFQAQETVPNAVTTGLSDGRLCVIASTTTDVVVDVQGYYAPSAIAGYNGVVPTRAADSREARGKLIADQPWTLHLAGAAVPGGVASVTLNVTVTEPAQAGYLTVYPCGMDAPWASNLNFAAGQTVANAVTVGAGSTGDVCFTASTDTHVVVDVNGFHR